jgi:hypothetical protein
MTFGMMADYFFPNVVIFMLIAYQLVKGIKGNMTVKEFVYKVLFPAMALAAITYVLETRLPSRQLIIRSTIFFMAFVVFGIFSRSVGIGSIFKIKFTIWKILNWVLLLTIFVFFSIGLAGGYHLGFDNLVSMPVYYDILNSHNIKDEEVRKILYNPQSDHAIRTVLFWLSIPYKLGALAILGWFNIRLTKVFLHFRKDIENGKEDT